MSDELFIFIGTVTVFFLLCFFGNYFITIACEEKAVSFEEHDYGFIKGCMVKHKGQWLPLENIRGFD
jgi:hypothetical protein